MFYLYVLLLSPYIYFNYVLYFVTFFKHNFRKEHTFISNPQKIRRKEVLKNSFYVLLVSFTFMYFLNLSKATIHSLNTALICAFSRSEITTRVKRLKYLHMTSMYFLNFFFYIYEKNRT